MRYRTIPIWGLLEREGCGECCAVGIAIEREGVGEFSIATEEMSFMVPFISELEFADMLV